MKPYHQVLLSLPLLLNFTSAKEMVGKEFNGLSYIKLPRILKGTKMWDKILENPTPGSWHLDKALTVEQSLVFDTPGDELECEFNFCRKKTLHAQGSIA